MMNRIRKRHIALIILLCVLAALGLFYLKGDRPKDSSIIRPYDQDKDFAPLVALINANRFWIAERPEEFQTEKFLLWRAPNFDPARKGQATLEVIEVDKATAGFISYYKKTPTQGFIWLFAVDENFRRRGLGEKLMHRALSELKKQGAEYVTLYTRLHKTPALSLYQKVGFVEYAREEDRGLITLIKRNL